MTKESIDMTIAEFCDKHDACTDGRQWAMENCSSMQDAWNKLEPDWLLWVATRPGVLTNKELRLFAVHCARSVEHLMTDQRSKDAIAVAERHANGEATDKELAAARAAAGAAAGAAARAAAREAAGAAARAAAWEARAAAWEARAAAREAAWEAAWEAVRGWARFDFCQHLRNTVTPRFEVKP